MPHPDPVPPTSTHPDTALSTPPNPLDHQGLVADIAKQYRGRGVSLPDLCQEGYVGLMLACRRFDATMGFEFSTFAFPYVSGYITKAVRGRAWKTRLPVSLRDGVDDTQDWRRTSLFDYWGARERTEIRRPLKSEYMTSVDRERLQNVLLMLPERERTAVKLRFGIDSREPMLMREIGMVLGISGERAKQIVNCAVRRLKEKCRLEQFVA